MKISKRKDRDLYYANVKKEDGSYVKVYGKTKTEVRSKYDELTEQILMGTYVEKNPTTLNDWAVTWTENYFINLKKSTISAYKSHLKSHILPSFGNRKLQSIKRFEVQGFVNKLLRQGLSPKTVKNIHLTLHRMLKDAVSAEIINSNPADGVIMPKQKKIETDVLKESEIPLFLEASDMICPDYTDVYEFFLLTGLRVGELIGLTFDRYNKSEHSILIDRQLNKADKFNFDTPKHDVIRTVYLSEPAENIIDERWKMFNKSKEILGDIYQNKDGFIFSTIEGNHLTHTILYKRFKKITEKIEKPNLRIHDLRHTFATLALKSGMDIKTLQKTLGHSEASFTLNRYGHTTDKMQKEAATNFGQMFAEFLI